MDSDLRDFFEDTYQNFNLSFCLFMARRICVINLEDCFSSLHTYSVSISTSFETDFFFCYLDKHITVSKNSHVFSFTKQRKVEL